MSDQNMSNTKMILSTVASVAASTMLIRSIASDLIPYELRSYFSSSLYNLLRRFSSQLTIVIEEFQGQSLNQLFESADSYLGTILNSSVRRIKVGKAEDEKKLIVMVDKGEEIADVIDDVQVTWQLICSRVQSSNSGRNPEDLIALLRTETRSYELSFHKKHKEKVLNSYLPYVLERAKAIKDQSKVINLHTINNEYKCWDANSINLDHPMSFKTLAMDSELKKALVDDLDNFVKGKDYYRRIGKAWKRGYLLYGPPGTGKSSLIAAMANYLNYDIYDLDLTDVQSNSELRALLLSMSSRAIVVFEDIDCTIKLQNRESDDDEQPKNSKNKVTLSGVLNFIDGLVSCCGDERIMVFTTNHKEKLDPALLRPGRMDMHIHMSYCTVSAFRQLAYNYHGISNHKLFEQIEKLIEEIEVTPAEVSGELMKIKDAEASLQGLVEFLQNKKTDLQDHVANGNKKIEDQNEVPESEQDDPEEY